MVEETEPVVIAPEIIASEQAAPSAGDPASRYMTENRYGFPADFVYPLTDGSTSSMNGILDVIANYDNGRYAIGYSVYAYSDGMYA